jgi:hypothetical protein
MDQHLVEEEVYDDDLVPISLLARNPRMPNLYRALDHPLHPKTNPGNTYVFYTRPTEGRMQELLQAGEAITVDDEVEADLESAGMYCGPWTSILANCPTPGLMMLVPGDYVFTRNELGSRKPQDDVAVAWVIGP